MIISDTLISQVLKEELSKNEVESIVAKKIRSELEDKDFEKKIKAITADAISNFCKALYYKDTMWKSDVKR